MFSPLNDLLEKDDFTLEQVLEEDELIQEVKTRNTKLLELYVYSLAMCRRAWDAFLLHAKRENCGGLTLMCAECSLSQEDSVLKMIEYVVRTPEDPSDDMRTLKYPYMSCEVICCDIMSITETLAGASEGKIVENLFEFLYQPDPLDSRLAGYFEKVGLLFLVL